MESDVASERLGTPYHQWAKLLSGAGGGYWFVYVRVQCVVEDNKGQSGANIIESDAQSASQRGTCQVTFLERVI